MDLSKANTALPRPTELLVPNPKLRLPEQVREVMRFGHYSVRTEETYWGCIRQFILFHGKKHPREMGDGQVEQFLAHLATEKNVAVSTQNQALNARCAFACQSRGFQRRDEVRKGLEAAKRGSCQRMKRVLKPGAAASFQR